MLPLAREVLAEGVYRPLFFVFRGGKFQTGDYQRLEQLNLEWTSPERLSYLEKQPEPGAIAKVLPGGLRSLVSLAVEYRHKLCGADRMLRNERICLLVLMGDRQIGWETSLIKRANQLNVASLIVPFALSGPSADAVYRLRKKKRDLVLYQVKGGANRIAARLFPNWVFEHDGQPLLFYPGSVGFVARAMGIMPEYPWVLAGGAATRVAVENKVIHDRFVGLGVDADKMVITGHPLLDANVVNDVADGERLRQACDVEDGGKLVLFAVPNMAEHSLLAWDRHLLVIEEVIASMVALPGVRLVLNLHPKSDFSRYEYLQQKFHTIISRESIYSLISVCDIYVATTSSTVMQAIGLAKPTIILDYFNFGEQEYGGAPGTIMVKVLDEPESFAPALNKLLEDEVYYHGLQQQQRTRGQDWVRLDGRCTSRVLAEMRKLIDTGTAGYSPARTDAV